MGILRVIDDHRSTQPITVLVPEMTVIPESALEWRDVSVSVSYDVIKGPYRLVWDFEIVEETFIRYNWTLSDERRTIGIVGCLLEEAMPVLQVDAMRF
jgi:hypothetical protein